MAAQYITTTVLAEMNDHSLADRFDAQTVIDQIGMGNILAISGGRVGVTKSGIELPVRYGYKVLVSLAGNDTYTVRRVSVRSGRISDKGVSTDVHCEEVGEVAYRASCYRDQF